MLNCEPRNVKICFPDKQKVLKNVKKSYDCLCVQTIIKFRFNHVFDSETFTQVCNTCNAFLQVFCALDVTMN